MGDKLIPVLKKFTEIGLSESQLESIIDIPLANTLSIQGRNKKVEWFLNAVETNYNTGYLQSIKGNYDIFTEFLNFLGSAEDFRNDINKEECGSITYDLCFTLMHELGEGRTKALIDELIDGSKIRGSKLKRGISAIHILKGLVNESKSTGYSPEVILEFRRNEIDSSYFEEFD